MDGFSILQLDIIVEINLKQQKDYDLLSLSLILKHQPKMSPLHLRLPIQHTFDSEDVKKNGLNLNAIMVNLTH